MTLSSRRGGAEGGSKNTTQIPGSETLLSRDQLPDLRAIVMYGGGGGNQSAAGSKPCSYVNPNPYLLQDDIDRIDLQSLTFSPQYLFIKMFKQVELI